MKIILIIIVFFLSFSVYSEVICDNGGSNSYTPPNEKFSGLVTCYEQGVVIKKVPFKEGKVEGTVLNYLENGILREKVDYIAGKPDGSWKIYFTDTEILQEDLSYKNGTPFGIQRFYHTNGKLKNIYFYTEDRRIDTELSFNNDGKLAYLNCGERKIVKEDRKWCGWNGQSFVEIFSSMGSLKSIVGYKNGKLNGEEKIFHFETGKVVEQNTYKEGSLQKKIRYRSGVIFNSIQFLNGKKHGEELEYFDDGKLKVKREWDSGQRKTEIQYYQNLKQKKIIEFQSNEFILMKEYFDNGNLKSEGKYKNHLKYGYDSYYDELIPNGEILEYDESGKLCHSVIYENGNKNGEEKYFCMVNKEKIPIKLIYSWEKGVLKMEKKYTNNGNLLETIEYYPDGSRKY